METLKTYFKNYVASAKQHAVVIGLVAIVINLFVGYGIGFLCAEIMLSIPGSSVPFYNTIEITGEV